MPGHTAVLPDMDAGAATVDETVTANVFTVLLPQLLFALTEIVPPVVPAVTVIALVVDVPAQPDGNAHV